MARVRRYLGRVEVWLDKREREALLHIVDALAEHDGRPPHAYEDGKLDEEYTRLTGPELATQRQADVDAVRADLGAKAEPLRMDEDHALIWLRALNHLRLVAGDRLGISEDGWEDEAPPHLLESVEYAMLLDLGWIQQGILTALEG